MKKASGIGQKIKAIAKRKNENKMATGKSKGNGKLES